VDFPFDFKKTTFLLSETKNQKNKQMKHPWLLKNTQGHDYTMQPLTFQILQNVDVPSGLVKTILNINR